MHILITSSLIPNLYRRISVCLCRYGYDYFLKVASLYIHFSRFIPNIDKYSGIPIYSPIFLLILIHVRRQYCKLLFQIMILAVCLFIPMYGCIVLHVYLHIDTDLFRRIFFSLRLHIFICSAINISQQLL
jgi:hypothetical protein